MSHRTQEHRCLLDEKIDRPPTFSIAALWDLLFQQIEQKYLGITGCLFSVYILFGEETLSLPMISIYNLKSQKAEARTDGPPKRKRRTLQPQRLTPFWQRGCMVSYLPLPHGPRYIPAISLSRSVFGVGEEKEGRATPSCPRNT